jgi:hypothetical protein
MRRNFWTWLFVPALAFALPACEMEVDDDPDVEAPDVHVDDDDTPDTNIVNPPDVNLDAPDAPDVNVQDGPDVNVQDPPDVNIQDSPDINVESGGDRGANTPPDSPNR